MYSENKITINNLFSALIFLVLGIILLTAKETILSIVSKVIGVVLILIGLVKSIQYIYMKGKLGNYSLKELITGLLLIFMGVLFIMFSTTLGFAIRILVGIWTLFSGINRMVLAISVKNEDPLGFRMFFCASLIMIAVGIILTSGLFDKLVGLFIIIYSISEIVSYIYTKVNERKDNKIVKKKNNKSKKTKVIDAKIEG